jgi:hypothetical protein
VSSRFLKQIFHQRSNCYHYLSGGLELGEVVLGDVVEFGEVVVGDVVELGGGVVDPGDGVILGEVVVLGDVVEFGEVVGEVTIGALPEGTQGVVVELLLVPDPELVLLELEVELLLDGVVELDGVLLVLVEGWVPALVLEEVPVLLGDMPGGQGLAPPTPV